MSDLINFLVGVILSYIYTYIYVVIDIMNIMHTCDDDEDLKSNKVLFSGHWCDVLVDGFAAMHFSAYM